MFCPNCKYDLTENQKFCPNCGKKIIISNHKKNRIIAFSIIAVFVLIIIINSIVNGDTINENPTQQAELTTSQIVTTTQEEKPIQIGANVLISAYEKNELQADKLYDGKQLIVSGKVESISKNIFSQPYVTITGSDEWAAYSVQCFLNDESIEKAINLKPDDNITIQGKCSGESILSISLHDSTILA